MPGTGWIYFVHDRWDREILTQNENQRTKSPQEWTFTKYDRYNRIALTGVYTDALNRNRESMQQAANNTVNLRYEERNSSVHDYTLNRSFPQDLQTDEVLMLIYYDDYDFSFANASPYLFQAELGHTAQFDWVEGKETGRKPRYWMLPGNG